MEKILILFGAILIFISLFVGCGKINNSKLREKTNVSTSSNETTTKVVSSPTPTSTSTPPVSTPKAPTFSKFIRTTQYEIGVKDGWQKDIDDGEEYAYMPDGSNISVETESLPGEYTLDEYCDSGIELLKDIYTDYKLISSTHLKINSRDFIKIKYSATANGTKIIFTQWFTIKNRTAYIVNFGQYGKNNYESDVNEMINSFKIK